MLHGKFDVTPSVANHGLTVRSRLNPATVDKLPAQRRDAEIAADSATNAQAVTKYAARITDANNRDLLTVSENGLPLVGPASGDCTGVLAMAHNQLAVTVDARIAALEARIAQLEASK